MVRLMPDKEFSGCYMRENGGLETERLPRQKRADGWEMHLRKDIWALGPQALVDG